jgi:hypothetical protein
MANIAASVMPLQLDLYVQTDEQDPDTGALKKEWNYAGTLSCSAKGVISNSTSRRSGDSQTIDNRYKNEQYIEIRSEQRINIRHKITNIRNPKGAYIWTELNYPTETPTVFEVMGSTPITDPFGSVLGYNSVAKRSENQVIGI